MDCELSALEHLCIFLSLKSLGKLCTRPQCCVGECIMFCLWRCWYFLFSCCERRGWCFLSILQQEHGTFAVPVLDTAYRSMGRVQVAQGAVHLLSDVVPCKAQEMASRVVPMFADTVRCPRFFVLSTIICPRPSVVIFSAGKTPPHVRKVRRQRNVPARRHAVWVASCLATSRSTRRPTARIAC